MQTIFSKRIHTYEQENQIFRVIGSEFIVRNTVIKYFKNLLFLLR